MHTHDVGLVIGTRPEAIKLAPLADALARRGHGVSVILTGQQPLEAADHGLEPFSPVDLGCRGGGEPDAHVRAVVHAMLWLLHRRPSAMVLVQGDTSSALGGALGTRLAGVPLGHVEAGLRSHDRQRPWPEEDFRIAIDEQADLLFAPTMLNAANLRRENVHGAIHVTGNTAMDSRPLDAGFRRKASGTPRILVTCHRRESWGEGLRSIASALGRIARDGTAVIDVILHPNPRVSGPLVQMLESARNIRLHAPCSHAAMLEHMRGCDLLLSDSGGVQEEAPALGVPLLVLRERTERPEAVAGGHAILVGTDEERIVAAVRRLLSNPGALQAMARPARPFGEPGASERIADLIARWLAERVGGPQAAAVGSRAAARTASA